jgi:glycosyltransferase involved in cell wall biosynthesis
LKLLYQAFECLNEDVTLVLAGPKREEDSMTNSAAGKIIRTGYVPSENLRALYQGAVALTFPSFEEGFGLPLLEAMASGIPVVASRIPVFQEICGDAFLSFGNDSIEELSEAMRKIINDSTLRDQLIAQGTERIEKFSWRDTAAKTLEIYNHL